ncbi:hypothetical protein GeomeDRAFT_3328 [Geobacter metallireducens RCH3]|nr:hypothetical protein GeomeDRAFT_3328 [Geobacter metallireducens RCH3]
MLQEDIYIIQAVHYRATNYFLINLFIVMGEKVTETGNTRKTISEVLIKYLALTEDIERFRIRLRES